MTDDELNALDLTGWPVPDEFLLELGRLAWLWSSLETLLPHCIGKLSRFELEDPTPFILLAHTNFPQRLDMLTSLCAALLSRHPTLADYPNVVTKLRTAQSLRNKFLHNGMVYDEDTKTATLAIATARGKFKSQIDPVTAMDVRRACLEVHDANRALYKLVFLRDNPPIWVSRQGPPSPLTR